ncbi:MAG TPA: PadR family transcriptional regulator [Longimicrobiaceae bacterium]|nr:PadR family transcriptional regulator [Longimicrobiaceae bacterium]
MGKASVDVLQGSLDLLILAVLASEELHGWGVSKRIRELSREVLEVNQGSLYPALYRLQDQGLLTSRWGVSPEGRRAKLYRLTGSGTRRLGEEKGNWRLFSRAVDHILVGS